MEPATSWIQLAFLLNDCKNRSNLKGLHHIPLNKLLKTHAAELESCKL